MLYPCSITPVHTCRHSGRDNLSSRYQTLPSAKQNTWSQAHHELESILIIVIIETQPLSSIHPLPSSPPFAGNKHQQVFHEPNNGKIRTRKIKSTECPSHRMKHGVVMLTWTLLAPSSRNSAASRPVSTPPMPDKSFLLSNSSLMTCPIFMTCRQKTTHLLELCTKRFTAAFRSKQSFTMLSCTAKQSRSDCLVPLQFHATARQLWEISARVSCLAEQVFCRKIPHA